MTAALGSRPIGRTRWAIAEGYIPAESHGPRPEMVSHETACILNTSQHEANVSITIFFVVGGVFAGQVTVSNIVRGSAQFASVGYWIDRAFAGRGVIPLAVAMVVDHCFTGAGLHRLEIAIRPENSNSLRVVEKLGLREVGYAPRYLHIDGAWRDHRLYAITVEECPGGLVRRLEKSLQSHE